MFRYDSAETNCSLLNTMKGSNAADNKIFKYLITFETHTNTLNEKRALQTAT
jgi:hypothetical protein